MEDIEEITLEIDSNRLECQKSVLIENSDYFKVMFEGNFMERNQTVVKLQDVDHKSLRIILTLIEEKEHVVDEEDLLLVLQTACMLQFSGIRQLCSERINELMKVENCLKVWIIAESLDLKPLYLKAKNLSLTEFDYIKDTECLLELNLKQLHDYLGNIFLCVKNEIDVFTSCMKWWYENSTKENFVLNFNNVTEIFYYFLTFMDFNRLSDNDIKEIITYPDIDTSEEIITVLNNIIRIRNCELIGNNELLPKETVLLNCRSRVKNNCPCILVDTAPVFDPYTYKDSLPFKKKLQALHFKNVILYGGCSYESDPTSFSQMTFLKMDSNFKKLLAVSSEKYGNLEGFCMLGYKELIFFFGGEFYWGRGKWNENFWVYDTIRGRWERKTKLLCGRRHFESCIADDIIYIVGGTGNFRVLQDNMFWYNYRLDEWSKIIQLPCIGRQIKCCDYKNQLFLLNINSRCGYIFKLSTNTWVELKICDSNSIVSSFPEKFVIFSYKDYIYIKGSSIIKLQLIDDKLQVISSTVLKSINYDFMESTMCNGVVYTIYKRTMDDTYSIVFERYKVDQDASDIIFEYDVEATSDVTLCGESCRFNRSTKLFNLSHYSMVEKDTYLTDTVL